MQLKTWEFEPAIKKSFNLISFFSGIGLVSFCIWPFLNWMPLCYIGICGLLVGAFFFLRLRSSIISDVATLVAAVDELQDPLPDDPRRLSG